MEGPGFSFRVKYITGGIRGRGEKDFKGQLSFSGITPECRGV
jgi:hypothetical protein